MLMQLVILSVSRYGRPAAAELQAHRHGVTGAPSTLGEEHKPCLSIPGKRDNTMLLHSWHVGSGRMGT